MPDARVEVTRSPGSLGVLIQAARKASPGGRLTQEQLAKQVGVRTATIGAMERGDRLPPLDLLTKLAVALAPEGDDPTELLTCWLARWVEHKASSISSFSALIEDTVADQPLLDDAIARLTRLVAPPVRPLLPAYPRTLEGFPDQFQPLAVVLPDRREVPPESPADLFIQGGSATDAQFLPLLQGFDRVTICSDKLFVMMSEAWLRDRFAGTNLLLVGSAGVNWLTRRLSGTAIFRPLVEPRWRAWALDYKKKTRLALGDHLMLGAFWQLLDQVRTASPHKLDARAVHPDKLMPGESDRLDPAAALAADLLDGGTESMIVDKFRVPGFADAAGGHHRGQRPGNLTDFGVITFAPQPFDDSGRFVSIVCAGIHGPGTAHCLRGLFSQQHRFSRRQLGGVIRVRKPPFDSWPGRFEEADWIWETEPYEPEDILANLREARAQRSRTLRRQAFRDWEDDELDTTIKLVERLIAEPEGASE